MEVREAAADTTIADTGEKKPLKIDYKELFGEDHDEPVKEIVVVHTNRRRRPPEKERKSDCDSTPDNPPPCGGDDYSSMLDVQLKRAIERQTSNVAKLSASLPDKGAKLKIKLKGLEDELLRRQLRYKEGDNGWEKPMHLENSSGKGVLGGSKQAAQSSQTPSESTFATCFLKKLDDDNPNREQNTSNQASNAFDRELSYLNPCDKSKRKSAGKLPPSKRALGSKEFYAWKPEKPEDRPPRNGRKYMGLNGKQAGKVSLLGSLPLSNEKIASACTDECLSPSYSEASQALDSNGSKTEKAVVLVDEEEPELIVEKQIAEDLPSTSSEGKIYYPSREAPESLEILRSELKCLEPGECLTSTIMNFYIRFLQEECCPDNSSQQNFYFFNTYFYSKLQDAVADQKSGKESPFKKCRRWWKGVNIFQKAYMFLPINEDNHWSLAIICIPDEQGESGLNILHLDSLGVHSSDSIFDHIKRLLINEWKMLNEDVDAVKAPISDRIWQHLPRRIEQKYIVVPRQTNDYDCGLFVLYYMERFIQDAPERLTRELSSMFGKNWFKPQEASRLRGKIKKILQQEFNEEVKPDNWTCEPVCLSVNVETTKAIDQAEIS
ncbi:hypothetical protein SOVF_011010 [Spinacia oleracea]|uniref:Ubiquitin-like-specific protease 1D n=1 Tax=Spinacia oleracea TaxID=3562 RepID=A0ABM3QI14_SPIOL|nr:ubiquitin-like-specific protease 1D [Spinacia oleracea]KNA24949.1 hypothetical protein SOVF_011010 [Spinacia oleracea]